MTKKTVVIVGGGASGVLTALALARCDSNQFNLFIIDPSKELGRGRAYIDASNQDLLNVPAPKMSAINDSPLDFCKWLESTHAIDERTQYWPFVRRSLFGEYLQSKIEKMFGSNLKHIETKVAGLKRRGANYEVVLSGQPSLYADAVVLCSGYVPAVVSVDSEFIGAKKMLIVGSGLTAIDMWRRYRIPAGVEMTFVSRHGLLPLPHLAQPALIKLPPLHGLSPRQILQITRSMVSLGSVRWQDAADALRIQASKIWSCWSFAERNQFIRHVKSYWEVIRHRVPAEVYQILMDDLETGKLKVLAGRLISEASENTPGSNVQFSKRGHSEAVTQYFDLVKDATGAQIDQTLKIEIPGVQACKLGFGFVNHGAPHLWIVGPPTKGMLWEVTAIPEIRIQAEQTAQAVVASMNSDKDEMFATLKVHPKMVGESYSQYFLTALGITWEISQIIGGLIIHTLCPHIFADFASDNIRNLAKRVLQRKVMSLRQSKLRVTQTRKY